jgi:hypothetical protein
MILTPVLRSMLQPVSAEELSFQVSVTVLLEVETAVRLEGALIVTPEGYMPAGILLPRYSQI